MVITAVEAIAKRRSRVRVYADGVVVAELPAALARSERLAPGRAIGRAEIDAIVAKEERRRAMAAAAAMLARRPHSERQVRQRLARRQTDAGVVDETVARLLDVRLLDDAEFARAWAEGATAAVRAGGGSSCRSFARRASTATWQWRPPARSMTAMRRTGWRRRACGRSGSWSTRPSARGWRGCCSAGASAGMSCAIPSRAAGGRRIPARTTILVMGRLSRHEHGCLLAG